MQKIFYNARFLTMNENFEVAEAMLTNDDAIVFVGKKDEVLQMKTDETEIIDLKEKFVIPTFYDLNLNIYLLIEERLKNAKKDKFIEKEVKNNENYEKFINFDNYEKEFLKIQDELLKAGVTTVQENICSVQEFCFWKKVSESGKLKIDIIGYIDITKHKQIMDDNCRSYRKYKNRFRLGGYYLKLDGSILEKKAWLKKPYPKEHKYNGFVELGFEQLKFIIKTALEEKKQMVVHADGDKAVEEFLKCYEEQINETKVEDNFRPIVLGCNFVSDKLLQKMAEFKIIPNFNIENLCAKKEVLKAYFGRLKLKKLILLKSISNLKHKALFYNSGFEIFNSIKTFENLTNVNSCVNKTLKIKKPLFSKEALEGLITLPAYYCFDLENKKEEKNTEIKVKESVKNPRKRKLETV